MERPLKMKNNFFMRFVKNKLISLTLRFEGIVLNKGRKQFILLYFVWRMILFQEFIFVLDDFCIANVKTFVFVFLTCQNAKQIWCSLSSDYHFS